MAQDRPSTTTAPLSASAADAIRTSARAYELDRYLSALLSPRAVRDDLIVLAAFAGEVLAIAYDVSEPLIGEIRVQWWRDTLDAVQVPGTRSGHPTADAFGDVVVRHKLPRDVISDFLDAVAHSLHGPSQTDEELLLTARMTDGALFALAARILGADVAAAPAQGLIASAGEAYGLARVLRQRPRALARGRDTLPQPQGPAKYLVDQDRRTDIARIAALAQAAQRAVQSNYRSQPRALRRAVLPVALVEPYLRVLQSQTHDPMRDLAEIAPLERVWRLAWANWSGRI